MGKLMVCILDEGEATTAPLADGTFKKAKKGDIVEVRDDFKSPYFKDYKPAKSRKRGVKDGD